jgi:hypothetical protein
MLLRLVDALIADRIYRDCGGNYVVCVGDSVHQLGSRETAEAALLESLG